MALFALEAAFVLGELDFWMEANSRDSHFASQFEPYITHSIAT